MYALHLFHVWTFAEASQEPWSKLFIRRLHRVHMVILLTGYDALYTEFRPWLIEDPSPSVL